MVENVQMEVKSYDRIYISWDPAPANNSLHTTPAYTVAARKYTSDNNWQWVEFQTPNTYYNLVNIEANTEYEIKVGNNCPSGTSTLISYTLPQRITTLENGQVAGIICGQVPAIDLTNQNLIERLSVNDVVMAGDFVVVLISVSGDQNGWSGEAWTKVKWLGDTKIKLKYKGIKVNTDKRLVGDGYFETTYDPSGKNIADVDKAIKDIEDLFRGIKNLLHKVMNSNDPAKFKTTIDSLKNSTADKLGNNTDDATKELINKKFDEMKNIADNTPLNTPANKEAASNKIDEIERLAKNNVKDTRAIDKKGKKKKCYYEIAGNKFHNGETIFMPKSNKKYEVKAYKEATKPVDSKSVWTGFGAKKDSAMYVYTPATVSRDMEGSLLSTIFTRDSIYRITKKDKIIDSLGKVQDTLRCRVVVVEGNFSRCIETGNLRNEYGYDEMKIDDINDDHISVKSMGSTFVKLNCSLAGFKSLSFNTDKNKIVVENTSDPSVFKITSKQTTEKEEVVIEVSTKSFQTEFFAKLVVCIYKEVLIENGKFYGIAQTGNLLSRPPSLTSSLILEEAQKHLKYQVVKVEKISPMEFVDVNFDLNGNGVIDYYNDGNNPETEAIYKKLLEIKADAESIVLIKDKVNDVWRIKNSVGKGDTTITLTSSSTYLDLSEAFSISKPNGDSTEIFKVVSRKGQQITIDTDITKEGNQGFMNNHPKIDNNDLLSHYIKANSHTLVGLSASFTRKIPALIVGATESDAGQLFSHELSHGLDLDDVDKIGNIMHYTKKPPSVNNPFTYKEQQTVITGTPTNTGKVQNQWRSINRNPKKQ